MCLLSVKHRRSHDDAWRGSCCWGSMKCISLLAPVGLAAVVVSGCSSGPSEFESDLAREFCLDLSEIDCLARARCGCTDDCTGIPSDGGPLIVCPFSLLAWQTIEEDLNDGTTSFDPVVAEEVLTRAREMLASGSICEVTNVLNEDDLISLSGGGAFVGSVLTGRGCSIPTECQSLACDGVACVTRPSEGETCGTIRCTFGFYCDSSLTCVPVKANGSECVSLYECAEGYCGDAGCGPPQEVGASCVFSDECASDTCEDGTCAANDGPARYCELWTLSRT